MSNRPVDVLIGDILEAIEKIQRFTSGFSEDSFSRDDKTIDAVVRNLEIIGEASARLPTKFTQAHSDIPWSQIVGLRNRIVHAYFGIDLKIVWLIISNDIAVLKKKLEKIALQ